MKLLVSFTWIQIHSLLKKKHWEKINKPGFLGEELGYERNDFGFYGLFPALLPAAEIENCRKINLY